ncbi:hypothetical protein O3297_00690 [Janthinobacterium sp. SUN128]|uniref:hypothetical protein n=1 Tax=Janthinobacterium sp. SUN128 TaxID=3014790 RepID=UPI002713878F|nr:hypothetical protein [Janthinobacterium sp. SUN128]MDO8031918.1 hypothetical protein [Janthinobacterium sp. SUN128]
MALPNITPIPNNEPDAVPALWNTRYEEIDRNFAAVNGGVEAAAVEIARARGGAASLGDRMDTIAANVSTVSVEMQNAITAGLKYALDQSALANYSIRALKKQLQQEGEITIQNRGIVSGCAATKSSTAARNLSLSRGVCFANGRAYSVAGGVNTASVPSNTTTGSVTVSAYLYQDATGAWRVAVTPIGQTVPAAGIRIYIITVPAGNTDVTDPNLTAVTLTDIRRIEAAFPARFNAPAMASAVLNDLSANDYHLTIDVIATTGAPCDAAAIVVYSRATNGFTLALASAADNVVLRWRASKLNN